MAHRHIHPGAGVIIGVCSVVALIAAGCGSSGGGAASSTASGLTVADTLSAVTAKSGSTTAAGKPSAKADGLGKPGESEKPNGKFFTGTPAGAYVSDRLSSYVREDTREALSTPNGILCLMAQTGYDQMVNKGDYIALVDTDSCFNKEGDKGSSSSTGESSGASETANLDTAVLNVSRPDSASAQTIKMWLDVKNVGQGEGARVFARMVVDAGKSAANPWGLFTTDFRGKLLSTDGTVGAARFNGKFDVTAASGGQVALVYREVEGNVADTPGANQFFYARAARALLSIDTATGDAVSGNVLVSIIEKSNFGQAFTKSTEANVAYNATTFLSSVTGGAITSYDRTKFTYNIWRYGLYNVSDGSRVTRNSGFPIKTANGYYGNLGYWGLWIDRNAPAPESATGATITKQSFSGAAAAETFTIVAGPGKLMKRTKKTLTLNALTSVPMEYFCGDPACGASLGSQFRVVWPGTGTTFVKKYVRAQGTQGQQWAPASGNLTLPRDWNTFWVQGLSGNATLLTSTLVGTTPVIFHEETNVTNLQTANLPLYCTGGCLRANITQQQADAGCQPDGSGACQPDPRSLASIFYPGSPYAYLFSFRDLTLYTTTAAGAASAPVKTVAAVTAIATTSPNQWGFRTRGMVLASRAGAVATDNPQGDSFNQDAVYEWETGPNQWNRYVTAKDSNGKLVSFDPPIRVVYAHETANDVNGSSQYNGASFQLEYSGFGQLYGFPWVPGADGTHGGPAFGLKDGVIINPGPDATKEYMVRALNMEQTMQAATSSGTLKITALTPPVVTLVAVDEVIGARPTVTTPPAFIKGVAQ